MSHSVFPGALDRHARSLSRWLCAASLSRLKRLSSVVHFNHAVRMIRLKPAVFLLFLLVLSGKTLQNYFVCFGAPPSRLMDNSHLLSHFFFFPCRKSGASISMWNLPSKMWMTCWTWNGIGIWNKRENKSEQGPSSTLGGRRYCCRLFKRWFRNMDPKPYRCLFFATQSPYF